jgi:hypothetical protein
MPTDGLDYSNRSTRASGSLNISNRSMNKSRLSTTFFINFFRSVQRGLTHDAEPNLYATHSPFDAKEHVQPGINTDGASPHTSTAAIHPGSGTPFQKWASDHKNSKKLKYGQNDFSGPKYGGVQNAPRFSLNFGPRGLAHRRTRCGVKLLPYAVCRPFLYS